MNVKNVAAIQVKLSLTSHWQGLGGWECKAGAFVRVCGDSLTFGSDFIIESASYGFVGFVMFINTSRSCVRFNEQ